ncbi:hypothetical protein BDZ89DRAFT_1048215 [Hymenopellis radicata]|nr:hypothetical protein BDZ89DRAFT_1048215 [Hymenopellis radicata]
MATSDLSGRGIRPVALKLDIPQHNHGSLHIPPSPLNVTTGMGRKTCTRCLIRVERAEAINGKILRKWKPFSIGKDREEASYPWSYDVTLLPLTVPPWTTTTSAVPAGARRWARRPGRPIYRAWNDQGRGIALLSDDDQSNIRRYALDSSTGGADRTVAANGARSKAPVDGVHADADVDDWR